MNEILEKFQTFFNETSYPIRIMWNMKDFDSWNEIKKKVEMTTLPEDLYFYEREIWWIRMGLNIGSEQDGKGYLSLRPVLILKKHNVQCCLCISLTTINKDNPYHFTFWCKDDYVSAIISQIKLIDSKRLVRKIGIVSQSEFDEIKKDNKEK